MVRPAPLQPPATVVPGKVISLHNSGDIKVAKGLTLLPSNDAVANLADGVSISGVGSASAKKERRTSWGRRRCGRLGAEYRRNRG